MMIVLLFCPPAAQRNTFGERMENGKTQAQGGVGVWPNPAPPPYSPPIGSTGGGKGTGPWDPIPGVAKSPRHLFELGVELGVELENELNQPELNYELMHTRSFVRNSHLRRKSIAKLGTRNSFNTGELSRGS